MSTPLQSFADLVGPSDPVAVAGGMTQWSHGGSLSEGVRTVAAPAGVVAHEPGEMVVRVRAGTTLADLSAVLAEGGQYVALESSSPSEATVGGVLSCGLSGVRRLGWGPARDCVLEVTAVSSSGSLIRAGAPLVKNVTGFDLCRLLVGSIGTLASLAEVVLRCKPLPETERWYRASAVDPFAVHAALYRPLSVLWDGTRTWVALAGYEADVSDQKTVVLGPAFEEVPGPPQLPAGGRLSVAPASLKSMSGTRWIAEVGVGVVHTSSPASPPPQPPGVVALHRRIKENFDPTGRMNPGRSPIAGTAA